MLVVECRSYSWRGLLDHVCDAFARGVGVMLFVVYLILVGIRTSLILHVQYLLLVSLGLDVVNVGPRYAAGGILRPSPLCFLFL